MANPLTMLKLKSGGFQFIQELPVDAPPAKVWAAVLNFGGWFGFDSDRAKWPRFTFEPRAGGQLISELPHGGVSTLFATITYFEPNKLLRMTGPIGQSHLPVVSVFIWELQPADDGRTTLLRFGQRTFGFLTADMKKNYQQGWGKLLPQLKQLAESRVKSRRNRGGAKSRRSTKS